MQKISMKRLSIHWLIQSKLYINISIVPLKQRIIFAGINHYTFSNCNLDDTIQDGLDVIKKRINDIQGQLGNEESFYFNPSRTAQNGINFITRELVEELKSTDDNTIHSLFKLLLILNNEESYQSIGSFFDSLAAKNMSFGNFVP
jgi:hypothetical protein